ncbi:MAG TPA: (2Fe-2S)-binding protein, partial [Polyangia bacterium]|nr:(2Fe-2S)-binding protein [Polyangia bacterium]
RIDPELERDEVIQVVETRRGSYRKLIVRGTELIGAMLVGNTGAASSLVQALDRGDPLPDEPLEALCPNARFDAPGCADRMICNCNAVPESRLRAAIAGGATSVDELGLATRAGTGCGSCKTELARLLNQAAAATPVKIAAAS